jgi:precorrin-4/cobalt-precorrin-4 C11-methyltransferase
MSSKKIALNLLMAFMAITLLAGQGVAGATGKLFIVGTGPGDADLITVRAVETIQHADVIICSKEHAERFRKYTTGKKIISPPMLCYWQALEKKCHAPADVDRAACSQINAERGRRAAMIRDLVNAGQTVAMLEGGDPCIFGCLRWIKLEFSDDEFEVIPGISAFNVSNAMLKREVADAYVADVQTRSVILTSPLRNGERQDQLEELSSHRATMVFFMPREFENRALAQLRHHYPADTPVSVVFKAGNKDAQTILKGTLADFPNQTEEQRWQSLIYVGGFMKDALNLKQ